MNLRVAPADFSDWPRLLALVQEAFAYMDGRIDPPSSLHRMDVESFRAKAAAEVLIVAEDGDALVGCVFADVRDDCVYLGKWAVAAHARRQGVARAMLEAACTLAAQRRRGWLELQTRVELVENQATFAALGFVKVGESAHPGYDHATSITMRKAVPPAGG